MCRRRVQMEAGRVAAAWGAERACGEGAVPRCDRTGMWNRGSGKVGAGVTCMARGEKGRTRGEDVGVEAGDANRGGSCIWKVGWSR
jgi:hypothetical protein